MWFSDLSAYTINWDELWRAWQFRWTFTLYVEFDKVSKFSGVSKLRNRHRWVRKRARVRRKWNWGLIAHILKFAFGLF